MICCYDDVKALVSLSASKARKLYGVVYPSSAWWVRLILFFENLGYRIRRSSFRAFVHSSEEVDKTIRNAGLSPVYHRDTFPGKLSFTSGRFLLLLSPAPNNALEPTWPAHG